MYELVLRTNDKKIDVCDVIKKIIERHCHNSFYWKKLDTNNYATNFFVCEMEDKRRLVRKKVWTHGQMQFVLMLLFQ